MSAFKSRKQKKKEQKLQVIEEEKLKNMSEIEKEAYYKNSENHSDDHLTAKEVPDKVLVQDEVVEKIISDFEGEKIPEHHDIFHHHELADLQHEIKKHEKMLAWILIAVLTLFLCIAVTLNFNKSEIIENDANTINLLTTKVEEEINNSLTLQNKVNELDGKVLTLSETVSLQNEQVSVKDEEFRLLKLPTSYPLKGTAAIISMDALAEEDEEVVEEEYDEMSQETVEIDESQIDFEYKDSPFVMFTADNGTSVIATGYGKIVAIASDDKFGYAIKIDHMNGYCSVYRGYGVPLVSVGDIVSRDCILMKIAGDNTRFLYQITFEGKKVDPMEIMEING